MAVTFMLTQEAKETRLRAIHFGIELSKNETAYRNMSGGYKKFVHDLIAVASEEKE